ncbi:hypothetical protein PV04_08871 [Phialophora macrospora]|uniref:FAD-binding PCMH-type domain-containing protein n=1 Tax=Phialophora macrospora TaxID=1851006 RepID=A0A0D2FAG5_9EURO|nr:hypothetical protein PV04_08871 [Phialophora macrospora]
MTDSIGPQFTYLLSLLSDSEIILPPSDLYNAETSTWAAQKNLHPRLVLRPSSTESLSKVIAYLSTTDLDISIRGSGYGSASAKDVVVSMAAFDDFEFDREDEVLKIGAGLRWRDYYEKMERVAPDYHVVAARTPALSIGGSILSAGFSWLARQYGNTSDVSNFLDAECILPSGEVLWASKNPDLLWALRGGGGSFCVVTKFKLRAYKYTRQIWAGPIIIPRRHLDLVAKGVAGMQRRAERDEIPPQVTNDLYVVSKAQAAHMGATEDLLIVQAFDALGEEHGRSEHGFKWALDIPGSMDMTKVTDLRGVSMMQEQVASLKGAFKTFWQPLTVGPLDQSIILNAVSWFDRVVSSGGSISPSAQLVFECLCTRASSSGAHSSAWPRPPGMTNTIICAAGCVAAEGTDNELEKARRLCLEAPGLILPRDQSGKGVRIAPNAVESFHELRDVSFSPSLPRQLDEVDVI